jgi:hypothetical protein
MPKASQAPYEANPKESFEQVAALRQGIKAAEKHHELKKAEALEAKHALDAMKKRLYDLIDVESDPRPNLFSGITVAPQGPQAPGDWATKACADVVGKKDADELGKVGIATLGDLNKARMAEGGLVKAGVSKAAVKRVEKAVTEFLAGIGGPKPAEDKPKAKPKGGKKKAAGEGEPAKPRSRKAKPKPTPETAVPAASGEPAGTEAT